MIRPRLLCIDMAYTLKMVKERELQQEFESRNCGGYFEHVWGVHPMADVPENRKLNYEGFKPLIVEYSKDQTIIEGTSAYFNGLKYVFPLNFLISQIRFTKYLIALVKKEHIDIILSTDPYYSGLIGLFIKLFSRAKLVIWVIANNDDIYSATGQPAMPRLFKRRWVEKIIERIVFKRADLVAGGNQNNLEFALNNGANLNKSTVFPVGKLIFNQHLLDPQLRDDDVVFSTSKASYNFIYVGRLVEIKHPDDVLKAFAEIHQVVSDSALIIAGDGPMKEDLEILAKELNINNLVHFLGNINQVRLANILAKCFAVLSPLTGRSLIESALAGLPIVAYDRDWQLDFVEKNGAGLIVPFRDYEKMAEAAIYLIQHPDKAKEMAEASRKIGIEVSDLEKIFGHEQREFDKILKRSN
jgi:glycosyltransferase involved in cell wall biosynthesis